MMGYRWELYHDRETLELARLRREAGLDQRA